MTRVEIFGQSYKVRGEDDPAYLEELARFVDAKMRTIASSTGTADDLKVAILAALNIADEYFKLQKRFEEDRERVARRSASLAELLGEAVGPDDGGT